MVNHNFLKHYSSTIVSLLDAAIPYQDGITLCSKIKKDNEVPVILVTHNDHQMLETFQAGADDSKQHVKELRHDD
ncbi:response regulator [Paenibacillus sp. FJAT-27812]|uniref:response regulator n=1 Tax=Paenibacillus sp. FJAT-27812 TaxID=1684143 RepID=UPI003FA580A8